MGGERASKELFPESLWIPYVDPGFRLAVEVKESLKSYQEERGKYPEIVFLQNHGMIVAGEDPERIKEVHNKVLETLTDRYRGKRVETKLSVADLPWEEKIGEAIERIKESLGKEASVHIVWSGSFPLPEGGLTPDHVVYAHSKFFCKEPNPKEVEAFQREFGFKPKIFKFADAVFAWGKNQTEAELAMALVKDGALIVQLSEAFGGVNYMSEESCKFIESWEVEAYRRKVIQESE